MQKSLGRDCCDILRVFGIRNEDGDGDGDGNGDVWRLPIPRKERQIGEKRDLG